MEAGERDLGGRVQIIRVDAGIGFHADRINERPRLRRGPFALKREEAGAHRSEVAELIDINPSPCHTRNKAERPLLEARRIAASLPWAWVSARACTCIKLATDQGAVAVSQLSWDTCPSSQNLTLSYYTTNQSRTTKKYNKKI